MKNPLTEAEIAKLRQHMPEDEVRMIAEAVNISGREKLICPYLSESDNLSEKELSALEQYGIHRGSIHKIGEGKTRTAYRAARFVSGSQVVPVTITIPKESDSNSVNLDITRAKGDFDLREFLASKEIGWHPNLVGSCFSIKPEERRININEHASGIDLETLVVSEGPIKEKIAVSEIARQIISGLSYMHQKGYIHRDTKPSNIFINPSICDGTNQPEAVKIGDLQTAAKKTEIKESDIPTKGAAQYCHRSLLNAIATGKPAKATERTDIYSLGATLYFMLTGNEPSSYKVTRDENGREVSVGDKKFKLSLFDELGRVKEISDETEEIRIKKMVGNVPLRYRSLVYRCLTDKSGEYFETMSQVRDYLENPISSETKYLFKKAVKTVQAKLANKGISNRSLELIPQQV